MENIKVKFESTRRSEGKEMMVGPTITGQKAIEGLVKHGYLEPTSDKRNYALSLKRTEAQIPLSATLVSQGVTDGDSVLVTETNVGAGG